MSKRFEYGVVRVKDLAVRTHVDKMGKRTSTSSSSTTSRCGPASASGTACTCASASPPTSSVTSAMKKCSTASPRSPPTTASAGASSATDGDARLLAVTNPAAALMPYDDLMDLLGRYGGGEVKYADGVVSSRHAPRCGGTFQVGGDGFQNKFVLDTPIDGFGRPSVYLSLLRLVCSNGAVGYSPTFRSELSVGKGDDGVLFALTRVLDGFNNEDGYAALRQRFESATRSWASVNEVNRLYKVLSRLHNLGAVGAAPLPAAGGDGAEEAAGSPLFDAFHRMTGDLQRIYGMANLDALSVKRQRTLPAACKVYDLLNFSSEVATHHADAIGGRMMQAYLGDLISGEYDLEGTVDQFGDWRDFFVGSGATAETLADLNRQSR